MNDRPHYPWADGDHLFASELNAAIANAGRGNTTYNVLDFGADPTGAVDSSCAFAAALAARVNGRPLDVFAPAGVYLLECPITVGDPDYAQRLSGAGWSTVLMVGPRFPSDADGVIVIQASVPTAAQASVTDLHITFQQPPDLRTTTTIRTSAGGTTLTVADISGIKIGDYCFDETNRNSLPWQSITAKVTNVSIGNVVAIDHPAAFDVEVGDTITFSPSRSHAVPLSPTPTLNPGDPAIMYPWAIYSVAQSTFFDHILVSAAWNGMYIRGSTFVIGQYFSGCMNIGLDIDECFNFPKIDHYMMWPFNISDVMQGIYYDGETIAANFGEVDDLSVDVLQSWCGKVNLTSSWSWGQIHQMSLDGDNSGLSFSGLGNAWVHIDDFYHTGGPDGIGVPILIDGGAAMISQFYLISAAKTGSAIAINGGSLTIEGGYMWDGQQSDTPMIDVTGGAISIDQMRFDSPAGRAGVYLLQSGGSVRVVNSVFLNPPTPGAVAFGLTDSVFNSITNVELNGWYFQVPPNGLGRYEVRPSWTDVNEVQYTNGSSVFYEVDTPTSSQVALRPMAGIAGGEGKLRFFGTFNGGTDLVPRLAGSVNGGFRSAGWDAPYLEFHLSNDTNDAGSDAIMTNVLTLGLSAFVVPWLASSPSHSDDASAALGGVVVGGFYRNGSLVQVRVT